MLVRAESADCYAQTGGAVTLIGIGQTMTEFFEFLSGDNLLATLLMNQFYWPEGIFLSFAEP